MSGRQATSAEATLSITVRSVDDPPVAAFSIPGPERNAATFDNDLASIFEGANLVAASGSFSVSSEVLQWRFPSTDQMI